MASTAIKTEEEKKEYFDSPAELDRKVTLLAQWVQDSSYMTAFTGAGCSTAAGIPDYRSGFDTVLPTKAGAWEKAANKKKQVGKAVNIPMANALPTQTHMALVKLQDEGILKYLVSQNVDGLHRKSGILPNKLCELHGNRNLEYCVNCKKDYMRDFGVRNKTQKSCHDHVTGRKCDNPACRGVLKDSIINFGESLQAPILEAGFHSAALSDLCLAMGSSLRVTPAADIPAQVAQRGGRLVIVNLQKTPLNDLASLVIHAKIDDVINKLFEKLNMEIPQFKLVRRLRITKTNERNPAKQCIQFQGIDSDECPYSLFPKVEFKQGRNTAVTMSSEPMKTHSQKFTGMAEATIHFQGHYGEPPVKVTFDTDRLTTKTYMMIYDPITRTWEHVAEV